MNGLADAGERRGMPSWWGPAVALLVLAAMVPWYFYSPDDLFIHLRFAENLALRGEWAFNPGQPSAGATSPPWVLLLAGLLAAGIPGISAAKALATATAIGLVLLAGRASRGGGAPLVLAALTTVCLAGSHWLRLWSAAGMETPLPPLLLVGGMVAGFGRPAHPLLAGILLGLATTARPDAAPAALVLGVFAFWRLGRAARVRLLLAAGCAATAWPGVSRLLLGRWLPLTLSAKGGGGLVAERIGPALLRTSAVALSEMLPLLLLALAAMLLDPQVRRRWQVWLPPLVAAATFPAGYLFNHAAGGVAATGRYLVPWYVLLAVAAFAVLVPWWDERRYRRWVLVAAALTLVQSAALTVVHAPATGRYDDYHRRSLLQAARWLHHNAEKDDWIAAGDIGVLGYVGGIRVLDLAGIVNPQALEWARNGTTFAALKQARPRYFINPGWFPGFDPRQLDPYTVRTIFSNRHTSYRWSLHPEEVEVTLRLLDWDRTGGDSGTSSPG